MTLKTYRQTLELMLIFSLYFFSTILAFAAPFWLIPELVIISCVIWFILTVPLLAILNKQNYLFTFVENLKKQWIILPFLIFSGLSIFWSSFWEISLARWLILCCTVITGGYIGLRYSMKEIIRLLSVFGIYILLLSSLLVFYLPQIGIMNYYIIQGAWRGLYWHKNHMGLMATFINILFLINLIDTSRIKQNSVVLWGLLYIYSLFFIYKSDSVAAYLTTICLHGILAIMLFWLQFKERIRRSHYLIFIFVLVSASFILFMNTDRFFGILNRNTTLTGRVPMWNYLFETYIGVRPFSGYGFNAFWYSNPHRVALQKAANYPDPIIIADNGFIDILVNTGYIGLVLFLIFYLSAWGRSLRYAGNAGEIGGFFPVILLAYTLLANISWSLLFENEGFFMLNMISVLFCISAGSSISRSD